VTILSPSRADQAATLPIAAEPTAEPASEALSRSVSSLLAGVVERLYQEYGCCLPLSGVIDVVARCVHDIQATPAAALPELTERLARHRLAEIGHRPGP
jgi:hypothetical protein